MRELVFALEFRGRAGSVAGSETRRQARSTAPSQTLATVLGREGVRTHVEAVAGEAAVLESRVERFGDGTFVEDGCLLHVNRGIGTSGQRVRIGVPGEIAVITLRAPAAA